MMLTWAAFDKSTNRKLFFCYKEMPYDGQSLPRLLNEFFTSCRYNQDTGGLVFVTLKQERYNGKNIWYQNYCYGIVQASTYNGYRYLYKREFISRYPGYEHCKTTGTPERVVDNNSREFIFERVSDEVFNHIRQQKYLIHMAKELHGSKCSSNSDEEYFFI